MLTKKDFVFSSKFSCPVSGFTIEEIEPRLFSFNSPNGACPGCDGLGYLEKFDPNLIVGNNQLSLSEGVILPWNKSNTFYTELIDEICNLYNINSHKKWEDLSEKQKNLILYGDGSEVFVSGGFSGWSYNKRFFGVIGFLETKLKKNGCGKR